MTPDALQEATDRMRADGVAPAAIAAFARHHRQLSAGDTGLIAESVIEPLVDLAHLDQTQVDDDLAARSFGRTAVLKLNGGLGTSMGLAGAKSLLPAKNGRTFLDVIVAQVLALRARHGVPLPLLMMNSASTHASTETALAGYPDLPVPGVPRYLLQSRVPKLHVADLRPVRWPADPALEWCPPGHGDLYPTLWSSGVLRALLDAGYRYLFCSNADNLGATADPRVPGWMAAHNLPFVVESCRRIPADRKGGHLAIRKADERVVLRDTAQTSPDDLHALRDLDRHRYCNTNNIWIDLEQLAVRLARTDGVLDLPLIRNVKTVDPADATSPTIIQAESAMGAAVECFAGARSLLVPRSRFVPVKTTNDLLVLRSDRYVLHDSGWLARTGDGAEPFVELDPAHYRFMADFDRRFPAGAPSLRDAVRLVVRGDVTFGPGVVIRGDVVIDRPEPAFLSDIALTG